ncbi:MAG: EF-hand domain-containing protein [Thermomonas sp.]
MSQSSKQLTLAISAAIAAGSMFSMQAMAGGYMQDTPTTAKTDKMAEGKCGEGKCGGQKADAAKAGHEGSCGMAKMDTDKDGRLSRAEFNTAHKGSEAKFAGYDGDGDGFIAQAEMDTHHASMKKGDSKGKDDAAMKKMEAEGKCGEGKCGSK